MAIPDYQTIMLPLLELIGDKQEHLFRSVVTTLGRTFKLTEDELSEMLPSGFSLLFANRVAWARTYLKKAGLIDSPKRGIIIITSRGLKVLKAKPNRIDNELLKEYPEFLEFQNIKKSNTSSISSIESTTIDNATPEEIIENAYQRVQQLLAQELLDTVRRVSPSFFEKLVIQLLIKMGYGGTMEDAGKAIGRTGDEGIDGFIKEDKLGLDIIYIQAKRWQKGNNVGRPELQKFIGALAGQGAKKGVFITTSSFSKEALAYAPKNEMKIVLVDGEELAQLMIDYNVGVAIGQSYEIKKVDNGYFDET